MAPVDRNKVFQIRISEDEREMLEEIADHDGLSASDVVRQLIRKEHMGRISKAELANAKPLLVRKKGRKPY